MNKAFSPTDLCGADAVPHVYKQNPKVFCVFVRRKNGNLVIYEGKGTAKNMGVQHYWLDIEPAYKEAARLNGRNHDREDFSVFDYKAYGYEFKQIKDGTLSLVINAFKSRRITVRYEKHRFNGYVKLNNEICRLYYIYVHDTTTMGIIPTVEYIEVWGLNRKGKLVSERLTEA